MEVIEGLDDGTHRTVIGLVHIDAMDEFKLNSVSQSIREEEEEGGDGSVWYLLLYHKG